MTANLNTLHPENTCKTFIDYNASLCLNLKRMYRFGESPTLQQQKRASGDGRPQEGDFLQRAHPLLAHVVDQLAGEVTHLVE